MGGRKVSSDEQASGIAADDVDLLWVADAWIWRWNVQTDAFVLDERGLAILGYDAEGGRPDGLDSVEEVVNAEHLNEVYALLQRYLEAGEGIFKCSVPLRHRDGTEVAVQMRGRLVTRTTKGLPEWLVGVAIDRSEHSEEEERMRAASLYARSLIEASLDPLVTIGADGRIMDVNQATEIATGRSRQELIGSDFSDYFTDPGRARAGYQQVFTLGRVVDYPLTLQHVSGRRMDVLYNASTYHDAEGRVAGVFAAARDVTDAVRSQRDLQETNREVLLLSQMSDLLQSCQSAQEAIPIMRASLDELFPGTAGRAFLMDSETGQLDESLTWGGAAATGRSLSATDCWALRRSTIHEVNLGNHLNPPCHYLDSEEQPYLCVPLMAQSQVLGIIHLVSRGNHVERERFTHLARATADSISLALANIRLRENLQALSTRDPLTGLYNRRFLEDALARELSRAGRKQETGAVAMLDIDHFKEFNDTYGHEAGDAVLVAVAERLKEFRDTDVPCRFGGEEFLLVLTDLTLAHAVQRLERLREAISETTALHGGQPLPGVTVSIGVAKFPQHGRDVADLIRQADVALYRAKESGRNRVVSAQDL